MTDAATAAQAGHQAAGHAKVFPPLDPAVFVPQWIWLAISFALLYVVLARVVLPQIAGVLNDRKDRIRRDLDAAAKLKADTDKALAGYEKALGDARQSASGIAKDTRDKLAAETDGEKSKTEAQIAAKLQDAETRIAAMKSKALTAVNDIAAETAAEVVEKLIGQSVSAGDIKSVLATASR